MASTSTRYEVVAKALKLAGRGMELRTVAEDLLNDMLLSWSLEAKYPSLRKVGSEVTLSSGASTASLPSDFGSGVDNLMFGTQRIPLVEKELDEFLAMGGYAALDDNVATGRPSYYAVDREGGVFRFNVKADQAYGFIPIYFKKHTRIANGGDGDNERLWIDDDALAVQGLVELIYQFKEDPREFTQAQKVMAMKAAHRRGIIPMSGGGARMSLSRSRFKRS